MGNVVIVAHKFLTQPDDDLVIFLNEKQYDNVLHIRHSFSDAPNRGSYFTWYKAGNVFKQCRTRDYKSFPELLIYAKEFFFTAKWVLGSKINWNIYIGMDGLCALFGNVLRLLGQVKKTIFWAIDFVPENRFNGALKNKIYHLVNISSYKKCNEMWDLSPRMAEAREKFLGIKKTYYKKHRVVPYGVWRDRVKRYSYDECEKNTLVFMGHLVEKQGVQLVIKVIPEIVKKIPDFKFKVIGDGQYKENLIKLAKDVGVIEHCDFRGRIKGHRELENEIAKSCLAVAPYIKRLDTWTHYADPGKVKTYLACGVPVLLTDIPWNAREIEQNKCGVIILEDKEDIVSKILELMNKGKNQEYRNNAIEYSKGFDYKNIFVEAGL